MKKFLFAYSISKKEMIHTQVSSHVSRVSKIIRFSSGSYVFHQAHPFLQMLLGIHLESFYKYLYIKIPQFW
jgi:hypothetical protein